MKAKEPAKPATLAKPNVAVALLYRRTTATVALPSALLSMVFVHMPPVLGVGVPRLPIAPNSGDRGAPRPLAADRRPPARRTQLVGLRGWPTVIPVASPTRPAGSQFLQDV